MAQTKPMISIKNVVATATIDQKLDLIDITKKFPDIQWHPETYVSHHATIDDAKGGAKGDAQSYTNSKVLSLHFCFDYDLILLIDSRYVRTWFFFFCPILGRAI